MSINLLSIFSSRTVIYASVFSYINLFYTFLIGKIFFIHCNWLNEKIDICYLLIDTY